MRNGVPTGTGSREPCVLGAAVGFVRNPKRRVVGPRAQPYVPGRCDDSPLRIDCVWYVRVIVAPLDHVMVGAPRRARSAASRRATVASRILRFLLGLCTHSSKCFGERGPCDANLGNDRSHELRGSHIESCNPRKIRGNTIPNILSC